MLTLERSTLTSGLVYLCKALVEDELQSNTFQQKALPSPPPARIASFLSHQILIQTISRSVPDLFFGRNVKSAPDAPAKIVFTHYAKQLASGPVVCSTLVWVCCQQAYTPIKGKKGYHPKSLEAFLSYIFPLFTLAPVDGWDKKLALKWAVQVLDSMAGQPAGSRFDLLDLPIIPMATFSALFNAVYIPTPAMLEFSGPISKIYTTIKDLLFGQQRPVILTNAPGVIFSTLVGPLGKIDMPLRKELLSIIALIISSPSTILIGGQTRLVSSELLRVWISELANHTGESLVLSDYLIGIGQSRDSSNRALWKKIKASKLNSALAPLLKQTRQLVKSGSPAQRHSLLALQKSLVTLQDLTKPPPTFVKKTLTVTLFLLNSLLVIFLFYALVYVQCDPASTRNCPLPFSPQKALSHSHDTINAWIDRGMVACKPAIHASQVISRDAKAQAVDFWNLVLVPGYESTVPPLYNTYVYQPYKRLDKYDEWVRFKTMLRHGRESVMHLLENKGLVAGWNEFQANLWHETQYGLDRARSLAHSTMTVHVPHLVDRFVVVLDRYARVFVDQTLPELVSHVNVALMEGRKLTKTTARSIRKQWSQRSREGQALVRRGMDGVLSNHHVQRFTGHPVVVQAQDLYAKHLDEWVAVARAYVGHLWAGFSRGCDEVWKYLEGRPSVLAQWYQQSETAAAKAWTVVQEQLTKLQK
ncbi:hypothetical protein HDV03_005479 [Kappamyces sp. JEL0829]|nr:hypothetical protein HDV03_005479 [Kappamyces sp. JEL0829]